MRSKRRWWQLILVLIVIGAGWAGFRIGGHPHGMEVMTSTSDAKVTRYTCPMHRHIHLDHPGNCPICGMQLVAEKPEMAAETPVGTGERKPLYWYDPMKPDQHFDKPGKSPFMDMQLVPKYGDDTASVGTVTVSPQMVQSLGIRLAEVTLAPLSAAIEGAGTVSADENRIEVVQARAAGWVEKLYVRAQGEPVQRGQLLAEIYAPELYTAQQEFLLARRAQDATLTDGARERLRLLGVSAAQIARLEKTGTATRSVSFYSPVNGVVQELGARLGMQLMPGTTLFSLVDLSSVWVLAEIPEASAALANVGTKVDVQIAALAGRHFSGQVEYVYPDVTAQTRTLKLRVKLQNPALELKPGMYARVRFAEDTRQALSVPSEAVIRTGTRSVVIVAADATHFQPKEVRIGAEANGRTEILDGLEEGQQVVASGQFLIDSEANLRGAFSKIGGVEQSVPAPASTDMGEQK